MASLRVLRPDLGFLWAALALLVVEIVIAAFARDQFVRPYAGDSLAVVIVALALRSIRVRPAAAAGVAVAVAVLIEIGQWLCWLERLGFGDSVTAQVVLGSEFDRADLIAYVIGAALFLGVQSWIRPYRATEDGSTLASAARLPLHRDDGARALPPPSRP